MKVPLRSAARVAAAALVTLAWAADSSAVAGYGNAFSGDFAFGDPGGVTLNDTQDWAVVKFSLAAGSSLSVGSVAMQLTNGLVPNGIINIRTFGFVADGGVSPTSQHWFMRSGFDGPYTQVSFAFASPVDAGGSSSALVLGVPRGTFDAHPPTLMLWANPDPSAAATFPDGWAGGWIGMGLIPFDPVRPIVGQSQADPRLPDVILENVPFRFIGAFTGDWFDPPVATGYHYKMDSGSLFTDVLNFPAGFAATMAVSAPGCAIPGLHGNGSAVDFVATCGAGVSEFTISGISPAVDPADPAAFPLQLAFDTLRADFTMTPITVVPEVNGAVLMLAGLGGLAFMRRRRVH
jgi:hypothetical protein